MSTKKIQPNKHEQSIDHDSSVHLSFLESQSSYTQQEEFQSNMEQPSLGSQESQASVDPNGSKRYYCSLGHSFDLAYADFEEELKQRAKCRKRHRRKGVELKDGPNDDAELSATEA
jgi:hypothetical protein